MGWEYSPGGHGSGRHEGFMVAEFDDGCLALGIQAATIPDGHLAVDQHGDGTWGQEAVQRHGGQPHLHTRPAGEVVGWRVVCHCYATGNVLPSERWSSKRIWTRVPSPVRHDPRAFRIYAADDAVLDVIAADDVHSAGQAVWWSEHIRDIDAEAEITAALAAIRSAEEQLDRAVLRARSKQLSWARIGSAAGMSAQAAHERWSQRAREEESGQRERD